MKKIALILTLLLPIAAFAPPTKINNLQLQSSMNGNGFGITNLASIIVPTNTASFTISTNDLALNTYYTNANQRAYVSSCFTLTSTVTELAKLTLYTDQSGGGTFTQAIPIQHGSGVIEADIYQVGTFLQPNARFAFSNLSVGAATAAIVAGSSQWAKQ